MNSSQDHIPVLLSESVQLLALNPGERVLDVTLGLAGHAFVFANTIGSQGEIVGLDADTDNIAIAKKTLEQAEASQQIIHANFKELESLDIGSFDAIFADLGVSSPHFDDPTRGFSFRAEGPLDMRLDRTMDPTAAECIAGYSQEDLANVLFQYGEIRQSRKLAEALKQALPTTTTDLKIICDEMFGHRSASLLPQVFQALRIEVNDEMGALSALLTVAPTMLNPGGRLGIIAFHSLEDRMVKRHFKEITTPEIDDLTGAPIEDSPFMLLTKKAIKPSDEEISRNPRARSARLRGIARV